MNIYNHFLWMLFVVICLFAVENIYEQEQLNRGKAISHYLFNYHSQTVPPSEARFFDVMITSYDITVEGINVFQ